VTVPEGARSRRALLIVVVCLVVGAAAAVAAYLLVRDGGGEGEEQVAGPAAVPSRQDRFDGFGELAVELRTADGGVREHCLLAADTPEQRERGLMGVTDLGPYEGMLFRFPKAENRGFWMRNTPMPLSIAYFDAGGRFVSHADMAPCGDSEKCPTYPSAGPAQYALEVERGRLAEVGADAGATLTVVGPCTG
jgi:uncharacterized membrane protein (UPF0127 family)